MFDWRPSLLGNRKLNTPMHTRDSSTVGSDTLTTPVLLLTIATNSRKASVFYRAVRVLYRGGNREHDSVFVSQSPESKWVSSQFSSRSETSAQCGSVSGIRDTSAKVFIVIVTICSLISISNKSGIQSEPASSYQSHHTRYTWQYCDICTRC
jgi:hypothetical protein